MKTVDYQWLCLLMADPPPDAPFKARESGPLTNEAEIA